MKTVRFNVNTSYRNIPDSKYAQELKKYEDMRDNEPEKWFEMIKYGFSKFPLIDVKIGDVVSVPDWYYESQKSDIVDVARSFDKYRDRAGNRVPFLAEEAIRHGDISYNEVDVSMQKFNKFDLVESKKVG